MSQRILMGNEAIALGAIRAGVTVCTGYPGTPSSEVLETIARECPDGVYAEWSVNEKTALEVGAGAAVSGARVLVTMKQVGLNVASDPLMSLNYIGVKGGMVILTADDPGPISSQTEQDTRHFGQFAKLVVFDPSDPEEAYTMIADAFALSERIGRPVLFRPTTRVCHGYAPVTLLPPLPRRTSEPFQKDGGRWVIFPRLAYANHIKIEDTLVNLAGEFSRYPGNRSEGQGIRGIAAGGVSWGYVNEALGQSRDICKLLKVATVPFPEQLALEFLDGLEEVLVVEELDPVIEKSLLLLCARHGLKVNIRGKLTGDMPVAGEYAALDLREKIGSFLAADCAVQQTTVENPDFLIPPSALPTRPPVLCAGCPHRASFFAVKEATRNRRSVFTGDIGCYTLGNAPPLDMVDTCLCMGAGLTVAQGVKCADPDILNFAFIGDSTFFHTGLPGVVNAVYNSHDVIFVILDNGTTAMTGGQPHPGVGRALMEGPARKISIFEVCKSLGVDDLQRINVNDFEASKAAVFRAADKNGVRVILFEGPCIAVSRSDKSCTIDKEKCTGCGLCVRKLGCPALSLQDKLARIDGSLCTGCGLCQSVCPTGAISSL